MEEDMYNCESSNNCSSSSRDRDHRPSDEMSLFLHQILRSSSSSYGAHAGPHAQLLAQKDSLNRPVRPAPPAQEGISVVDLADGGNGAVGGSYLSENLRRNASSSSIGGVSENETDECDVDSEDGVEALVGAVPAKAVVAPPRRSSSKRSRAAEVHNLSEKRRRSRINEKLKALQSLIPNSNKTDKASMLDEAIEYLKQLQLQVQMLSLRNGISFYPTSIPGMLQPIRLTRLGFDKENGSQLASMAGLLSLNQESLPQATLDLRNQSSVSNQQALPDMSNVINLQSTFILESSLQGHFVPFPLHASSQEFCREDVHQHQQHNANHSEGNPDS